MVRTDWIYWGRCFYAHAWELTSEEYARIAQTKTGISHCPAPAVLGGFPILDIKKLQEMGIVVSLGCDGSATNDSSNELDALRMAYLMQAYHYKGKRTEVFLRMIC